MFKTIMALFVLSCLLNTAQSLKMKKSERSFWLFQKISEWIKTEITIEKIDQGKDITIKGESNFNLFGIYFTGLKTEDLPKVEKFVYHHDIEGRNATVIDFAYVENCKFDVDAKWYTGKNLLFKLHDLDASSKDSFVVKINYSLMKKIFASSNSTLTDKVPELEKACKDRKKVLEEKAKKVAADEARHKVIQEELKKKEEEIEKIKKLQDEKEKKEKMNHFFTNLVNAAADKIKLAEEKAVQETSTVAATKKYIVGPQIIIECPNIKTSNVPYDLKITRIEKSNDNLLKNWYDRTKDRTFHVDFEKSQYSLSLRNFIFSTSIKIQFSVGFKNDWRCDSEYIAPELIENEKGIFLVFKPVFKECENWCALSK